MRSIKKTNELTGKIIDCEDSIADLSRKITSIQKDGSKVKAKMTLEINGPRSQTMEWLTNEEVVSILERRRNEEAEKLKKLDEEYNKPE